MTRRAAIELTLAVLAAAGCVVSWLAARSGTIAEPVVAGEPSKATTAFDPSLVALSVLLLTAAGVLAVVGVARLRRG